MFTPLNIYLSATLLINELKGTPSIGGLSHFTPLHFYTDEDLK